MLAFREKSRVLLTGKSFNSSSLKKVRRARASDTTGVKKLLCISTKMLFGTINVDKLLHTSVLTLILENACDEIIAAMCLNSHPNVPSIPPWSWQSWLYNIYAMEDADSRNSLWVHMVAFNSDYSQLFLKPMFEYLFMKCIYVQYVFFVIPPNTKYIEWLEEHGTQITPKGHSDPTTVQTLFLCLRQHFVINYKLRRAVVEDNDDLVPLISTHSDRLEEMYGEFYIAEMIISHQDSGRKLIVAEHAGYAVAVMCLNDHVNYDILNEAFKLEPFYGLRKPDPRDTVRVQENLTRRTSSEASSIAASEMLPLRATENTEMFEDDKISICSEDTYVLDIDYSEYALGELPEPGSKSDLFVMSDEDSAQGDADFAGRIDNQISCAMLSYTEQEIEKWHSKSLRAAANISEPLEASIPKYFGEENAFVLEIAASQPEHEVALVQLMDAAFQCFPDKEYCAMCIPSSALSFPLMSKLFVRVTPRVSSNFPHELYVVHRSATAGKIQIRPALPTDRDAVIERLSNSRRSNLLLSQFHLSLTVDMCQYRSYVALCDNQVIGLAIVSDQDDIEYIESHYQVASWTDMNVHKTGCHGAIEHISLSPIFQRHARFFMVEILRYSGYTILYYKIQSEDLLQYSSRLITCVLGDLVPVIPIRMPEYDKMETDYWKLPEAVGRVEMPYALYIATAMHCGMSRYEVNAKIVVVGASDVGVSFLVSLLFKINPNYKITYNNVTLVSPHGLCQHKTSAIREILLPATSDINGYYLSLLSLPTYVNIVNGVMSAIDRKERTITVNNTQLPYDMLFLMCGQQFQMPERSEERRGKRKEYPNNVFVINTEVDADAALAKLTVYKNEPEGFDGNLIIYGFELEAYCCIEAMLAFGIPGSRIIYVQPTPKDEDVAAKHKKIFNDFDISETVYAAIANEEVKLYSGYTFIDWTFDSTNTYVTSITFESSYRMIELSCFACFMYDGKYISKRTFLAINQASLVFDGALVIDPNCQTNDKHIYAAGTIAKYPRRYYADHMAHKHFNRVEIGHKLAEYITEKLIPEIHVPEKDTLFKPCSQATKMLVPQYYSPITVYCQLPGRIFYMRIRKPGLLVPKEIATGADDYGQILTTGDPQNLETQGYFRLHLNQYNTVETITCLAKFEIEKVNLTHLWGKHEQLLKNLVKRFEMILIPDLYAYFKEPWTYAIYHDRFQKFDQDATDILTSLTENDGESLIDDIVSAFEKSKSFQATKEQMAEIEAKFTDSPYHKQIEEKFLEFLLDNLLYLPMYAHPIMVNVVLGAYEESILFKTL